MSDTIKIRIAESDDFSQSTIDFLKTFATVEMAPCTEDELAGIFEEVDVFWFRLGFKIHAGLFSDKTRVKIIATPVTGIDHIDEIACKEHGVQIACLRGEYKFLDEVKATAEFTMALTLAVMRNLVPASNSVNSGVWDRDLFRGNELYQKTVGILGYGRLGKITAGYFIAFGCRVLVYDPREITEHADYVEVVSDIDELLAQADIVTLHINYTQQNHEFVNKNLLDKFKTGSVLINTSRGGIVNEADLLGALQSGKLSAAAIDVIQNEFTVSDRNALIEYASMHSNLLISPHIGGNTYESFKKTEQFIAEKIKNLLKV